MNVSAEPEPLESLLAECQRGDLAAFARLFARCQPRLFDLAAAILQDETEAEDVVQETLLRVFERLGSFRGEAAFDTWLTAIAVNRSRDRLRRRRARRWWSLDSLAPGWLARLFSSEHDPAIALDWREQQQSLWEAVDRLDDRLRLPVVLRYHGGLSCDEIGRVLGLSTATVYSQLSAARRRLRGLLAAEASAPARPRPQAEEGQP
jgi:RNA polymerase sigma-70 factor (ECF subfamily)